MALDPALARLSKILVDVGNVTFDEAQTTLRNLRLHIVVGRSATSQAAQAAVLTIVAAGLRTFVGGVKLSGALDLPLVTTLPVGGSSLGHAAAELGAKDFDGSATQTILVGANTDHPGLQGIRTCWRGWRAGASNSISMDHDVGDENPLVGIAAGALALAAAFQAARTGVTPELDIDLWPATADAPTPAFNEIFLPSSIWMVGLGNLGQAYLWALSALPYTAPSTVSLVLQDHDRVTDENWATSILVRRGDRGSLKNQIAERWATAKGFCVRRLDRRISSLVAAITVTRAIAIASGCEVIRSEVGRALDPAEHRCSPAFASRARGIGRAGRPGA